MVRYLHVLQGGLLSLCVQQGEISVVLLTYHLNCFCHLPYQKLSAENKKKCILLTAGQQFSTVLVTLKISEQYENWLGAVHITCSLAFRTGSQAFTQWK